jgi:trehalose-phosphatase
LANVAAGRLLVISDFDGTLSEIVAKPEDARLAAGAGAALKALAKAVLRVCILSSRGSPQLRRLVPVRGVELLGDYGMTAVTERQASALRVFNEEAKRRVERWPGVRVEEKPGSTAIHYRNAPTARTKLDAGLAALARKQGLVWSPGRAVFEVRPKAADKSIAVVRLIELLEPAALVYLGDDENDRPVFELLANHTTPHFTVGVRSDEVPRGLFNRCDLVVDGPLEAVAFLSRLAAALAAATTPRGRAAAGRSSG